MPVLRWRRLRSKLTAMCGGEDEVEDGEVECRRRTVRLGKEPKGRPGMNQGGFAPPLLVSA